MTHIPTVLVADDEPLLRTALVRLLADCWPEARVVAEARNGREAIELFERHLPSVCFLDVHMPGLDGVAVARAIQQRAQVVFVTAYDKYAVQAFAEGVLDYLVKPVERARLAATAARLQARLAIPRPESDYEALLARLAEQLKGGQAPAPLRWIRAQSGSTLRLIAADDVDFFRSDAKYTVVAWRDDGGRPAEAIIRVPLKDLVDQLDPEHFVQIHRAVVVNLRSIDRVVRSEHDTATVYVKGRTDALPVSRTYLNLFRQM